MNNLAVKGPKPIQAFDFDLPNLLECALPTEARGLARDEVKLLVSNGEIDKIQHATFRNISDFLKTGDLLIVNTSGTIKAAIPVVLPNGQKGRMHLSTKINKEEYLVEIRQVVGNKTKRIFGVKTGQKFTLPNSGMVEIMAPYYQQETTEEEQPAHLQLWKVRFKLNQSIEAYLSQNGQAIAYNNLAKNYPIAYYQTCFANEWGSSEMPSAGRAFTPELVTQLLSKGIQFAPILLHTGISSLETNEKPYPEFFSIAATSAKLINQAKAEGRRVIAIGTTAIRAVESAIGSNGEIVPQEGMTHLFITPERGLEIVNGLLTGFHEPKASHLLMMQALASEEHLRLCYNEAIQKKYQWHEFGDMHLLI